MDWYKSTNTYQKLLKEGRPLDRYNYSKIVEEFKVGGGFDLDHGKSSSNDGFEGVDYEEETMKTWEGEDVIKVVMKLYEGRGRVRVYPYGLAEVSVDGEEFSFATDGRQVGSALHYACYKAIVFSDKLAVAKVIESMKVKRVGLRRRVKMKFFKSSVETVEDREEVTKMENAEVLEVETKNEDFFRRKKLIIVEKNVHPCGLFFSTKVVDVNNSECELYINGCHFITGPSVVDAHAKTSVVHMMLKLFDGGLSEDDCILIGIDVNKPPDKIFVDEGFISGMFKYHHDVVNLFMLYGRKTVFDEFSLFVLKKFTSKVFVLMLYQNFDHNVYFDTEFRRLRSFYHDYFYYDKFNLFVRKALIFFLLKYDEFSDTGDGVFTFERLEDIKKKKTKMK